MNLTDRALLVQLNVSQWTARKYDKRASKEVTTAHGAASAAGRFNKSLLPMNDKLENIYRKTTLIRTKYYESTLPWGIDGTRMLPTANYLSFMTDFRKEKGEWEQLVQEFLDEYGQMKLDAQRTLGSLYDPDDYPTALELRYKFNMDMAVFPVPSADFRVAIGSEELKRIQQDVERRVKEAELAALKDVWNRLYERVKHIAEKLADPKAIFRDSMIETAKEICALLPRLNFADDPNLEAMRQQVEASLIKPPEALRNDPDLRRDTAAEAKAIMDKMGTFMGAL